MPPTPPLEFRGWRYRTAIWEYTLRGSSRRARAHPRDASQVQNDRVRRRSRPATNVQADLNASTLQFAFPRKSAPVRATGISCER